MKIDEVEFYLPDNGKYSDRCTEYGGVSVHWCTGDLVYDFENKKYISGLFHAFGFVNKKMYQTSGVFDVNTKILSRIWINDDPEAYYYDEETVKMLKEVWYPAMMKQYVPIPKPKKTIKQFIKSIFK